MPTNPTLAEVLSALDRDCGPDGTGEGLTRGTSELMAEFFFAHRAELEHSMREWDARKNCDIGTPRFRPVGEHWPVVFREAEHRNDPPRTFTMTQQCVLVGRDWRPEKSNG